MWQKLYDDGRKTPDQFYQQPEVHLHLQCVHVAFYELSTERQSGMGLGPIPSSKIKKYARKELGLFGEDDRDWFFSIIRQMDDEYMRLSNEKTPPQSAHQIPIDDVDGVKSLFDSLEKREKNTPSKPHPKKK